jgi:hypothetical protein
MNCDLVLDKINKFGKYTRFIDTQKIIEKISYKYPYDRTFGNPFVRTPKYDIRIAGNTFVYFSYGKNAYLIQTSCRNESIFLSKVLDSKLYRALIIHNKVPILHLKLPEYNKFHDHNDIDKFLRWIFHL